ncbi:MAG: hypothetical protein ABH858_05985, partial [Candidatus Omnitrophota bacterium]
GQEGGALVTDIDYLYAYAQEIYIEDAGSFTAQDVQGSGVSSVNLTAENDLYVNYVYDPGDVTLTSNEGAILDSNGDDLNVETQNLVLSAATGIGTSDNLLDIEVTKVTATTTTEGAGIYLNETDDVVVDTIDAASGTGDVKIVAGGAITDVAGADTIIADHLTMTAATGIGTSDNLLDIEVTTITATTSAEGAGIYLNETDDVVVDTIDAASGTGDVKIVAGGSIADEAAAEAVIADHLILTAATGIGTSGNLLDIKVTKLTATTTQDEAGIYLDETDSVVIDQIKAGSGTGDVKLTAGGSITDVPEAETIIADHLTLTAATGIGTSDNPLDTEVNTLNALNTDSGDIVIENTGDMYAQSVVNDNGDITVTVNSNLTVGEITAENVYLTANSGSILDDINTVNYITATVLELVASGSIGTSALGGDIDVDVDTLSAVSGGNIYIEEKDGAAFLNVTADGLIAILAHDSSSVTHMEADDSVTARLTSGDLTILTGTIVSNNAGVNLIMDNGSILAVGAGPHIISATDSLIELTGGTIAITGSALKVDITGRLFLDLAGAAVVDGVIGYITGTITGGPSFVNTSYPSPLIPAGKLYFNGAVNWPPVATTEYSLASDSFTVTTFAQNSVVTVYFYTINSFNPSSAVFFYHPLTSVDYSAFDDIILDADAYEFIEGRLSFADKISQYFTVDESEEDDEEDGQIE